MKKREWKIEKGKHSGDTHLQSGKTTLYINGIEKGVDYYKLYHENYLSGMLPRGSNTIVNADEFIATYPDFNMWPTFNKTQRKVP